MSAASLPPRTVALLCALRQGPRTVRQLHEAIGDDSMRATLELINLVELESALIVTGPNGPANVLRLSRSGADWLAARGVAVSSAGVA